MTEEDWAVPETDVLAAMRDILAAGRDAMIATVVGVEGSAYRRPGAKMLVEQDGIGLGHITAGCLEDEVFELGAEVIEEGAARIETYDLMEDDDDVWGLGVGCNGIIDILLEPLDASYEPVVSAYEEQDPIGVITVLSGDLRVGSKAYFYPNRDPPVESEVFPEWLRAAVEEPAMKLVNEGGSRSIEVPHDDGEVTVFIDTITPPPQLVVVGSGHDVGPVVELGKKNDFQVTVVGFRGATDLTARFPRADSVTTTAPTNVSSVIAAESNTYAVVMSHNFIDDRLALDELLTAGVEYVGLMGPRERFDEMMDEFAAEDRSFSDAELASVYTPVGLDLGGGSPYQIATSIIAEVMAVANDRDPKHLKEREGPIHDRTKLEV